MASVCSFRRSRFSYMRGGPYWIQLDTSWVLFYHRSLFLLIVFVCMHTGRGFLRILFAYRILRSSCVSLQVCAAAACAAHHPSALYRPSISVTRTQTSWLCLKYGQLQGSTDRSICWADASRCQQTRQTLVASRFLLLDE